MLGKAGIHHTRHWIDVTKEYGIVAFGFDVNPRVAKVGVSSILRHITVHDHGGHARSRLVRLSSAVAVAVRSVPIGFFIVPAATKVLNTHKIFLSMFVNVQIEHVIGIIVDAS